MKKDQAPYLSVVVCSRNDNHGEDMLKRMRLFMRNLAYHCKVLQFDCELIVVEWNPVQDALPLAKVVPGDIGNDWLSIRYVTVPANLHTSLAYSDKIPLFQMIAKNVGIRRASGKFVLCTNIDILFSDGLFKRLSRQNLEETCFYRANRCDVPAGIQEEWSHEQQMKFCASSITKRNGKNTHYPNFSRTSGLMFRLLPMIPVLKVLSRLKALFANRIMNRFNELDFDACGDFTLMSKTNWLKIEGYPELEMYSIHIDSLAILAASALELKQVIFQGKNCSYHIEHRGGWEFDNPIHKLEFVSRKPMLDWWTVREAGLFVMRKKTTYGINKPNWGFADVLLPETTQ